MKRKESTPNSAQKKDKSIVQNAEKLHDLSSTEQSQLDEADLEVEEIEQKNVKRKKLNPVPEIQTEEKEKLPIWKEREFVLRDISHKLSSLPILFNYATTPKNSLLFENPKNEVLNIGFCIAYEDGSYQFKNYDGEYEAIEDEDIVGDLRKLVEFSNYVAKDGFKK